MKELGDQQVSTSVNHELPDEKTESTKVTSVAPKEVIKSDSVSQEIQQEFRFSEEPNFETLRLKLDKFASDRDWNQYHTPRNLLLALVGEIGELSELFQWRGEVEAGLPGWSANDKQCVSEEMSDVLLYLLRLADKCGIDLPQAALMKMSKNEEKYPANLVRGSSAKYTEYVESAPKSS